ncbi:MAG: DUF3488 and transglutaminase-like domain-containing protein, partial [Pirellulales bacterium]|nr:DUF3488 and transglutaminase-like domain-containing protein [Pirellulales bacterium]
KFQMGPTMSSVVALAAAAVAAWQMVARVGPSPFISMANLLSYLQVVLLYQRKTPRVYWQLVMLSLLQVVVSTAMNSELSYGLMVFAFMFLFTLAMMLLLIVSQSQRCAKGSEAFQAWTDMTLLSRNEKPERAVAKFAGQHSPGPLWTAFGCGLVRRAVAATAVSLVVATFVFFLVPRKGRATRLGQSLIGIERLIGFSETVELGQAGQLRASEESVMSVTFTDAATGEPYEVIGEPLFRGAVLSHYANGRWLQASTGGITPRSYSMKSLVRQQIQMDPLATDIVPAVYPAVPLEFEPGVWFDNTQRRWRRSDRLRSKGFRLVLGTTGFRNGMIRDVTPCFGKIDIEQLTQLPRRRLPKLIKAADEVLEKAGLDEQDRRGRAKALERFLLDPGNGYRYSLTTPIRTANVDPTEDFMTRNPMGHCEYFASALTLMLRSQGIPARMVTGFRGGEFNPTGGYWTVNQDRAHAWVEAYLEPHQIEPDEMNEFARKSGGWLRLDPTPGGVDSLRYSAGASWWSRTRSTIDYLRLLWSVYVDKLNVDTQQESIYRPIASAAGELSENLGASKLRKWLDQVAATLDLGDGRWFSLRAAFASVVIVAVFAAAFFVARRIWQRWGTRELEHTAGGASQVPASAQFYRRLEDVMQRYGYARRPGQTHREMAEAAGDEFATGDAFRTLATLPSNVVDAYYQVRFGERPLSDPQMVRVNQSLDQLEAGLELSRA